MIDNQDQQQPNEQRTELSAASQAAQIINAAAARYEIDRPRPDARPQDRAFIAWYRAGLLAIGEQVKQLHIRNLTELDLLFRQVYLPHAVKNGVQPTILDFSLFTGINADMLTNMASKKNSQAAAIYNSWLSIIKEFVIGVLSTEPGSNINLIFIAKSIYGIKEDKNINTDNQKSTVKKSREQIISELGGENVENSENVENL